jgi:5'-3' exonuclease
MAKNLVLDGNYLLHKNIFTLIKMNTLYGDFFRLMTNNIMKYSQMFNYDKIIIVSDSRRKSWRKRILDKYKEHRKRDQEIDWEWIFKSYLEWKQQMHDEHGAIILEADSVEGDDWISAILTATWKQGDSNIVISSDKDLLQLIKWNDNQINIQIEDGAGKERVFFPTGYQIYLNSLQHTPNNDPFALDMTFEWDGLLHKLHDDWIPVEINPKQLLLEKLVKGDKGDNIDSVYQKLTKTGKMMGIGEAGATKVWEKYVEDFDENYDTKSPTFINRLAETVCAVNKLDFDTVGDGIVKKLSENKSLIELHHRHWPEDIKEKIVEQLESVL